jgi:hypothetical protein
MMPLEIRMDGPYAIPTVLCDHCGEAITDAQDGNYQWSDALLQEDPTTPMYFTHKACCDAFEQVRGGMQAWSAIGLECLPYLLARNLRLTWQQAQAAARLLGRR